MATRTQERRLEEQADRTAAVGIVDCDVHNGLRTRDALKSYVDERRHADYDRPSTLGSFAGKLEELPGDEVLLFGSDDPHRSGLGVGDLFDCLGDDADRVMSSNATAWCGLDVLSSGISAVRGREN